jgi:hypothetical protein
MIAGVAVAAAAWPGALHPPLAAIRPPAAAPRAAPVRLVSTGAPCLRSPDSQFEKLAAEPAPIAAQPVALSQLAPAPAAVTPKGAPMQVALAIAPAPVAASHLPPPAEHPLRVTHARFIRAHHHGRHCAIHGTCRRASHVADYEIAAWWGH